MISFSASNGDIGSMSVQTSNSNRPSEYEFKEIVRESNPRYEDLKIAILCFFEFKDEREFKQYFSSPEQKI